MILCGWCEGSTAIDGLCRHCGRDPVLPWAQRAQEPPAASESHDGRPRLTPGEAKHRLRLAAKALGLENPTQAQLAEQLEVDAKTIARWQKLSG